MGKILIIEDDVDMVEAMRVILESRGHKVIACYHPDEGYEKAKEEKFDLIILDVMFGSRKRTQGFDYAVKFKQDKELAPIPILMLTAVNLQYPTFGFSPKSDNEFLPVDEFIDKPAQPEELVSKVEKLLQRKRSIWANWPEKREE